MIGMNESGAGRKSAKVGLERVVRCVSKTFRVKAGDIANRRFRQGRWHRREPVATARLAAYVLALEFCEYAKVGEIAQRFKRDEQIMWYARRRISGLEQTERWFA